MTPHDTILNSSVSRRNAVNPLKSILQEPSCKDLAEVITFPSALRLMLFKMLKYNVSRKCYASFTQQGKYFKTVFVAFYTHHYILRTFIKMSIDGIKGIYQFLKPLPLFFLLIHVCKRALHCNLHDPLYSERQQGLTLFRNIWSQTYV